MADSCKMRARTFIQCLGIRFVGGVGCQVDLGQQERGGEKREKRENWNKIWENREIRQRNQ